MRRRVHAARLLDPPTGLRVARSAQADRLLWSRARTVGCQLAKRSAGLNAVLADAHS
jgi:hypothetical protein